MRATLFIRNNPAPPEMADRLPGRVESVQKSGHLRLGTHSNAEEAMTRKPGRPYTWKVVGNHVCPINDLRPHRVKNCWCGPEYDDGLTVHNSLDRREEYEDGQRKPS